MGLDHTAFQEIKISKITKHKEVLTKGHRPDRIKAVFVPNDIIVPVFIAIYLLRFRFQSVQNPGSDAMFSESFLVVIQKVFLQHVSRF